MPNSVCRFYMQGNCRFGDKCRYDHPTQGGGNSNSYNSNNNQYAPLSNHGNSNNRSNGYQQSGAALPFSLDKDQIVTDLSSERPQWILSAYGPGRHAPAQLFGGPIREQSFEEMRLLHYLAVAAGNPQQAAQEAEDLFRDSDQQIQNILQDVDGAVKYLIDKGNEHPNRIDIVQGATPAGSNTNPLSQLNNAPFATSNPLGNSNQTAAPSFGAPSQSAAPAFGAPSGAFGQPSALGAKPNAFGTPSAFTPAQSSAFGQPSQLGSGAFGKPSQLGAGSGAFGQPSSLGPKPSAFGAPSGGSAFGGAPNNTATPFSAFGSNSNAFSQAPAANTNPFGAASQPTTSAPFGASSQPAQANPFGQPSGQAPNSFGGVSAVPFGAASPAPTNPFAAPPAQQNPFGAPAPALATANPFTSTQPNPPTSNPFGAPPVNSSNAASWGAPAPQTTVNGNTGSPAPPDINTYCTKDHSGRLLTFKGSRVVYQNNVPGIRNMDGTWSKIWFPEGAPAFYKDTEMDDDAYDDATKTTYLQTSQSGSFQGGMMPIVAPKREWCNWQF